MSERPIPFRDWEVRATLKGDKTQTRRVIKPQPTGATSWLPHTEASGFYPDKISANPPRLVCKYGKPGDLLWVRETWGRTTNVNDSPLWPGRAHIPMDGGEVVIFAADGHWQWCDGDGFATERSMWRPSIHMPRWASRIKLEVKSVRVERLQDISEADARAEGVAPVGWIDETDVGMSSYREGFSRLWDDIHAPGAWDDNPWVWVISFERVKP